MKKLTMYLSLLTMMFVLSACAGMTAKKDTVFPMQTKVLLKPLSFQDTALDKISGDELKEYEKGQPEFAAKFKEQFAKYAKETGYFDQVLLEGSPDASTVVVEPRLNHLDPGIRAVLPATASVSVKLYDSTGKQIGKFSAQRVTGRPVWTSMMGSIETLIKELGEDTASKIGEAR